MTPIARPLTDYVEKAATAWNDAAPDWIVALAEACSKSSQSAVAKKVGYSAPTLSAVLGNAYKGNMAKVEEAVRWQLIGETVPCPVLGTLRKTECLEWQAKPYAATSSHRVAMYRACRDRCPHSRIATANEETAS
nr:transcriptional regulator [uncultured Shinella sp.]